MNDDRTTPTAPSAPSAPTAPGRPSYAGPRGPRFSATGRVRGKLKPGMVEYEVFRMESKGAHPYPWRNLDHLAKRKVEQTLYTNQWEAEVLRYAASLEGLSVSKYVLQHGIRAALKRVLKQESGDTDDEREAG